MSVLKLVIEEVFNSWIDVLDLSLNSSSYIIIPKEKIVCRNCKKVQTVRQTGNYVSFLCGCGCRIYYPPTKEGLIVTKYVTQEEYEKGGHNGRPK
jgi:hypothetical protein